MSLTFYYSPMSSATRVHWALEELGVPYEKVRIDLAAGEQQKPEFRKLNPNGKVPLLVVDGHAIFESLAQLLFLGETYGVDKGLFPKPGLDRAEAFKWMCWVSVSMHDATVRVLKNSERAPAEERNAKARETALRELGEHLRILDAHLAGKEHLLGGGFTLVDAASAAMVPFLARLGVDTSSVANVNAWVARCMARPALARVMAG
ncbi:MAG TPA: glutathione S-transferase family protein [Labilithrix sp.]|jgi:glutathione S-transferase